MQALEFQQRVLVWFDEHGRKDLPWQDPINPYRVWVSEIMLQQTQVVTVIGYFERFMLSFPSIESLAKANIDEVLKLWAGLGYYARARNLHKAAQVIVDLGEFPNTLEGLTALSGIGESTAGAILSIAFQKSTPILDGNVRRVLARFKGISGWTGGSQINKVLWKVSAEYTPQARVADYTQAIMDLGATLCTRSKPRCLDCPLNSDCIAYLEDRTTELPTPKARKKIPVKQCIFLILENQQQQILVEKRPPTGIWGGLWSLPEFSNQETAQAWCLEHAFKIQNIKPLETQRHTFSHYHLDYTPLRIYSDNPINNVMEANHQLWYKPQQTTTLAFPAPITRLLQDLYQQEEHNDENG